MHTLIYLFSGQRSKRANTRKVPTLSHLFALLVLWTAVQTANAGVFMCAKPDGGATFQDSPCPVVKQKTPSEKPKEKQYPLGIHASWFDKPQHAPDKAFCSKRSCDCGPFSRRLKSGLTQAVADALYLDGSWHRLDNALVELEKIQLAEKYDYDAMYEVKEAACNILMSQKILTKFASQTVAALSKEVSHTTSNTNTLLKECETGNSKSCEMLDQQQLKKQIESDADALKRERAEKEKEESDGVSVIAETER